MRTRAKRPAETVPVPQSAEEASDSLAVIGAAQRGLALLKAAADETVARAKAEAEAACQPLLQDIEGRTRGLEIWAAANRSALAEGKSIRLPAGTLAWRQRPPSVRVGNMKLALEAVLAGGKRLAGFLRTKHELNKEALLAAPEAAREIPGISIGSAGEEFVVEPVAAAAMAPAMGGGSAAA